MTFISPLHSVHSHSTLSFGHYPSHLHVVSFTLLWWLSTIQWTHIPKDSMAKIMHLDLKCKHCKSKNVKIFFEIASKALSINEKNFQKNSRHVNRPKLLPVHYHDDPLKTSLFLLYFFLSSSLYQSIYYHKLNIHSIVLVFKYIFYVILNYSN